MMVRVGFFGPFDDFGTGCGFGVGVARVADMLLVNVVVGVKQALREKGDIPPVPPLLFAAKAVRQMVR